MASIATLATLWHMPSGKKVTPLFGKILISLSAIFCITSFINEFGALAARTHGRSTATKKKRHAEGLKRPVAPGDAHPYIVVLDPGHGGADTGASGDLGKKKVTEKEVALAIAMRTQTVLENPAFSRALGRPVKVLLTRNADTSVSLEDRSEMAKKAGADLFVSIHANSEPTHRAHGLETYFLNNTDDESSLKLQQIENRLSQRNQGKGDSTLLLRSIAADAAVAASRSAAETLHSSLVDELLSEDVQFLNRGVRQAMLYVLLDSQVPAVLVEAFYLSHAGDLALVSQPENRTKIAEGLAKGVLRFLASK